MIGPDPGRLALIAVPALLLPLGLTLYYEWLSWQSAGPGFPLDDAWIHAQFARNIATGRGFTYTGPQWVAGSTAPLWTVVLAIGYFFTHNILIAAKVLGVCFQLGTAWWAGRLLGWLTGSLAARVVTMVAVGTLPIMAWGGVSGMEVALASFLVVTGLFAYLRGAERGQPRDIAPGIALLTLAALARPENLAIVGIVLVDLVTRAGPPRMRLSRTAVAVAVAAVTFAPAVWLSETTIGRPLPTTFYAKSGPGLFRSLQNGDRAVAERALGVHAPTAVTQFGVVLRNELGPVVWLLPVGALTLLVRTAHRRSVVVLLVLLIAMPYLIGAMMPQRLKPDNVRYVPQLVVLAAVVTCSIVALIPARRWGLALLPVVGAALIGSVTMRAVEEAPLFALSVKNIQQLQVALGKWMRDHLPTGSVVAVNDVGAIAYFSGLRILDIEGLVTPEALPYRAKPGRGLAFTLDTHPDYVAIFPTWYPEVVARTDLFQPVHQVAVGDNYAAGGSTLVVLRTPWTRQPPIAQPVRSRE